MRNRLVDDTYKRCDHKFHGWSWNLKKHINAQQNSSFDERRSKVTLKFTSTGIDEPQYQLIWLSDPTPIK